MVPRDRSDSGRWRPIFDIDGGDRAAQTTGAQQGFHRVADLEWVGPSDDGPSGYRRTIA